MDIFWNHTLLIRCTLVYNKIIMLLELNPLQFHTNIVCMKLEGNIYYIHCFEVHSI